MRLNYISDNGRFHLMIYSMTSKTSKRHHGCYFAISTRTTTYKMNYSFLQVLFFLVGGRQVTGLTGDILLSFKPINIAYMPYSLFFQCISHIITICGKRYRYTNTPFIGTYLEIKCLDYLSNHSEKQPRQLSL